MKLAPSTLLVTETDIIYKVAAFGLDPKTVRVYEIMVKPCVVINPELGVEYVARLFAQTHIRRAPVIQGKTLLGIVSVSDILFKSDFVENPKRLFIEDEIEIARTPLQSVLRLGMRLRNSSRNSPINGSKERKRKPPINRSKKRNRIHSCRTARIIPMPWNVEFMTIRSFSPKIVYEFL